MDTGSDALSYEELLAVNIRTARLRAKLDQETVGKRMAWLGFKNWHRQTLGKVERGERRVLGSEILGLALATGTTVSELMGTAGPQDFIHLPNNILLGAPTIERLAGVGSAVNDRTVVWAPDGSATITALRRLPEGEAFSPGTVAERAQRFAEAERSVVFEEDPELEGDRPPWEIN